LKELSQYRIRSLLSHDDVIIRNEKGLVVVYSHNESHAGRVRPWRKLATACCYLWFYSFNAAMNSFRSSFACFIIEINVPFASSG